MSDDGCVAGCGRRVTRPGSRCPECRKAIRAARARARRGAPPVPPLPPDTAEEVLDSVAAARFAVDSLLELRMRAARDRGPDAMPQRERDMWMAAQSALIAAQRAARTWQTTARDIRANTDT